jgi:hypothetical protein
MIMQCAPGHAPELGGLEHSVSSFNCTQVAPCVCIADSLCVQVAVPPCQVSVRLLQRQHRVRAGKGSLGSSMQKTCSAICS